MAQLWNRSHPAATRLIMYQQEDKYVVKDT